jgi:carbon starvation protein CstA
MITFLICFVILVVAYFTYGKFVEVIMQPDANKKTPALTKADGVDYVPMPAWKMFMIQFLNIAGLGPIFGAIMGAKFGTSAYIWIVIGCIFAGATHDYVAGMLSLKHNGESLPDLIGRYLGKKTMNVVRVFSIVLMILVGVVFMRGPAGLLENLTSIDSFTWTVIIFVYYLLASMLPIDKVIGKVYPLFALALIFMAVGIMFQLVMHWPSIPEVWDGVGNTHPNAENVPIFPMLFISIACGAISGFHATQSPMMARCMTNEKQGRPIFYGAMIVEGIVALIWAAAANYFFMQNGKDVSNAAIIVNDITKHWLGAIGAVVAVLGVIFAPITSGDTAFRSARLIVADMLKMPQQKIKNRLIICVPLFVVAAGILWYSLADKQGFDIIWRYFAWSNQTLSVFTLWAMTVYLYNNKRKYTLVALIPALLMTMVTVLYILIAPEGFTLPYNIGLAIATLCVLLVLGGVFYRIKKSNK